MKPGYQYFEVTEEEIEPIKTFKTNMTDYVVAYNRAEKGFVLKKNIYIEHEAQFTQIMPVDESAMYDLLLTVDNKAKRCYISTGIELLDTMKTTNVDLQKEITFSFTKKGDPHVLYDMALRLILQIQKNIQLILKIRIVSMQVVIWQLVCIRSCNESKNCRNRYNLFKL